jgi:hypothetical protein
LTCTVATTLAPSRTVKLLRASAVPVNTGWASRLRAEVVSALTAGLPPTLVTAALTKAGVLGATVSITSSALEMSVSVVPAAVVLTCTL